MRAKPNPLLVENKEQAEGALAELSKIQGKLKQIEITQQETIDRAKSQASQQSSALFLRKKELENSLAVYGKLNKKDLFEQGKGRSIDLGFGTIGFRASTEIAQQKGITAETTVQKLKEFSFLDGIKTTETVNRNAMTTWSDEKLETVGLCRKYKDTFYIEVKEEDLINTAI